MTGRPIYPLKVAAKTGREQVREGWASDSPVDPSHSCSRVGVVLYSVVKGE